MKYFKVKIYPDGSVIKEEISKDQTYGLLGCGMYSHFNTETKEEYEFFVDKEEKIQGLYDRYVKRKIRDINKEIKQLQKLAKTLERNLVTI